MPNAVLPADPWTISSATKRSFLPESAAFANTERAGTIASRNGSATAAPMPRSTVRRDIVLFEINIRSPLPLTIGRGQRRFDRFRHPERRAVDDAEHERRHAKVVLSGVADDRADRGHVGVLDPPSERVGHQVFG